MAVVLLALPAFAHANPLLSGYGAPGQGSQALLGSALAGPRGGGGGGSGGSGGSREVPAQSIEQSTSAPTPTGQSAVVEGSGSEGRTPAPTSRPASSHTGGDGAAKGGSALASGRGLPPKVVLEPKRSVHTDAAGLSGGDLALILLAIGVIAATGALTARLARGGRSSGGGG